MKTISIKNLIVQFDTFDDGADKHTAMDMIDAMNEVLRQRFPDASPIIAQSREYDCTEAIREENIEIHLTPDDRTELINRIMENCFRTDRIKNEETNRAFLEEKSDEELQDYWDEWENAQYK